MEGIRKYKKIYKNSISIGFDRYYNGYKKEEISNEKRCKRLEGLRNKNIYWVGARGSIDVRNSYINKGGYIISKVAECRVWKEINKDNHKLFKTALQLGAVNSLNGLKVIQIERIKAEKSRVSITKELFKFLNTHGYSKVLVITFSKKESHYRFSLIIADLNWISEAKVEKKFSNPKRLSFLLGVGSKVHTATKHLIDQGKVKDFDDLYGRFNYLYCCSTFMFIFWFAWCS